MQYSYCNDLSNQLNGYGEWHAVLLRSCHSAGQEILERFEVLREVRYTSYTRILQRREPHVADILLLYLATKIVFFIIIIIIISVMQLGHLLTRSGLTYPEVSSNVCHDSFCQLENSVSLPWVISYEAFYLHVVSSFSCIPVICPKLVLLLIPL